jgi:hypothetical protein
LLLTLALDTDNKTRDLLCSEYRHGENTAVYAWQCMCNMCTPHGEMVVGQDHWGVSGALCALCDFCKWYEGAPRLSRTFVRCTKDREVASIRFVLLLVCLFNSLNLSRQSLSFTPTQASDRHCFANITTKKPAHNLLVSSFVRFQSVFIAQSSSPLLLYPQLKVRSLEIPIPWNQCQCKR